MDMEHMHHSAGIGSDLNHAFARAYWYMAAGVVGLVVGVRAVNHCVALQRLKACADASVAHTACARPRGRLGRAWATATALVREASHPQLRIKARCLAWASPPPLGRALVLLAYWAVVAVLMSRDAVVADVFYHERIGYRNAWVTLAQLPMAQLLAVKCASPLAWLLGCGPERLSWLHRWVARTMLVVATVHGFSFWTEWERADFVAFELSVMPMVKYGLGAWAVLLWSVVAGFLPVRRLAYELWLLQHLASVVAMLWLLYRHIPASARYLLWMTVGLLAYDRLARWLLLLRRNLHWSLLFAFFPSSSSSSSLSTNRRRRLGRFGHEMSIRAVGDVLTVLTIRDVSFKWCPGQHVYLWVPRLGPLEAHPYTIGCAPAHGPNNDGFRLVVRTHAGFSKRIHDYASRHPERTLMAFLSGPYGVPPRLDTYETLVLIGASTGASFVVPMLESIAMAPGRTCVRSVDVALIARTTAEIGAYLRQTKDASRRARDRGMRVRLHVAITAEAGVPLVRMRRPRDAGRAEKVETDDDDAIEPFPQPEETTGFRQRSGSRSPSPTGRSRGSSLGDLDFVHEYVARPDIEALVRQPVEQAWGETAVVVCGGAELVARTRNCVSRLSDERAVHKGTGAQGIYLYVEEYAF
ncbi:hypothetical protein CDD83_10092 [Cordyceps sp. RAO-2017]|nr:hypothetical protein CDD83_10092 [Cordyceps sp. RAO-2017]